jgi:hypothetical protein
VASALATNFLPDPIISIAVRDSKFMPLLYLLPVAAMIVGWLLLAGSDARCALFSGRPRRPDTAAEPDRRLTMSRANAIPPRQVS